MAIADHWAHAMNRLVRVEMARKGWTYGELYEALQAMGVTERGDNPRSIGNKVSRGTFSAVFLAQAMLAMGVSQVRLDGREIEEALRAPRPGS